MHPPTGPEPANTPRLRPDMAGLELWYYLLEVPEQEVYFGFRHVVCQPRQGPGWAELQALRWDADGFSQACERFPLTSVRSSERFFFVQTGKSWLRQSGAWGEIQADDTVQWELDWQPQPRVRPLVPPQLENLAMSGCLAQPWLLATGTIAWGVQGYALEQVPALQGHLVSQSLPFRRWWGAATAEDIHIESLCTWIHAHLPPLIACTVHYEGRDWITAGWEPVWRNRTQVSEAVWRVQAQQGERRAELEWRMPPLAEMPPLDWDKSDYQLRGAAPSTLELRLFERASGVWKLKAHLELTGCVEVLARVSSPPVLR